MIEITALRWVPPLAQGLVRDLRVRWALDEAGLPYKERLVGPEEQKSDEYRTRQPFGQVPVYEDDGLVLFESGAIVLHIAERSRELMPAEAAAREHVRMWMFAALNSIEQHLQLLAEIEIHHVDAHWARERRPTALQRARTRLADLDRALHGKAYLVDDRFSAADLMMTTVLRIPRQSAILGEFPEVEAYRLRCEARPAFKKALADQLRRFEENRPAK
jgi:glutathione S-transferase